MAAAIHAFVTSSDWQSIQHAIRLDLNVDVQDHIRRIAAPTLLITAKHDRIVPEFYSQQLARLAVGVQRAEIDSGHLSFLEQAAPLATTISSFVDSVATPDRTGNRIIHGRVSRPKEVAALIEEAATDARQTKPYANWTVRYRRNKPHAGWVEN